jgi:hypothetical protein
MRIARQADRLKMVTATSASPTASARDLLIPLLLDPPDLTALSDPAAWSEIKETAARHGVAQLIAFAARSDVSLEDRAWCDRVLTKSWTWHGQSLAHLDRILGVVDKAAVPCIALKGPALALRNYRPPFLRKPSLDLDLGIREQDLERTAESLMSAGFRMKDSITEAKACSHHLVLSHASLPPVELHFRLTHGALGISMADFFPGALQFQLPGGRKTLVLGPADEILHLILHLAHARFDNLFHAHETRRLWRAASPEIRDQVIRRAVAYRYSGVLALVDIAFRTRWGEPFLPPDAPLDKTWLHWRVNRNLYQAFEESAPPETTHTVMSRLRASWLEFQITDRFSDGVRFVAFIATVAFFELKRGRWYPIRKKSQAGLD